MPNVIDERAFDFMTTAVDKTAVSLFEPEDEKGTKGIHTALLAAGMTPAYGNIADIADATLYALEGEFGEAAWSMAAAIPIVGQMVSGKRALKAAKEAGEEMLTLYRGVDRWYPGKMVKDGKFIGKQYLNPVTKKVMSGGKRIYLTPKYQTALDFAHTPLSSTVGKSSRIGSIVLEFEVPKSFIKKNVRHVTEGYEYLFQEGIPREFLKKVHK